MECSWGPRGRRAAKGEGEAGLSRMNAAEVRRLSERAVAGVGAGAQCRWFAPSSLAEALRHCLSCGGLRGTLGTPHLDGISSPYSGDTCLSGPHSVRGQSLCGARPDGVACTIGGGAQTCPAREAGQQLCESFSGPVWVTVRHAALVPEGGCLVEAAGKTAAAGQGRGCSQGGRGLRFLHSLPRWDTGEQQQSWDRGRGARG